jgi:hypothetical protein
VYVGDNIKTDIEKWNVRLWTGLSWEYIDHRWVFLKPRVAKKKAWNFVINSVSMILKMDSVPWY